MNQRIVDHRIGRPTFLAAASLLPPVAPAARWPRNASAMLCLTTALWLSACHGPSLDLSTAALMAEVAGGEPDQRKSASEITFKLDPPTDAPAASPAAADSNQPKSAPSQSGSVRPANAETTLTRRADPVAAASAACNERCSGPQCAATGCGNSGCASCPPCPEKIPLRASRDEYLCDGGDFGLPVGVRTDRAVVGLEQEDTVVHFEAHDGRTWVQPSNRVCVYAPRFAAVRRVVNPMGHTHLDIVDSMDRRQSLALANERQRIGVADERHAPSIRVGRSDPSRMRGRQQAGALERLRRLAGIEGQLSAYADLFVVRAGIMVQAEEPLLEESVASAIRWTANQGPQVLVENRQARVMFGERQAAVVFRLDEPEKSCLRLIKLASRPDALPGETIEFTLRVDNVGSRTVSKVVVVDNLSTRLEYIPTTAQSSLEAEFSSEANTGGSLVLRWELAEPLAPGRGAILQFRCRVR